MADAHLIPTVVLGAAVEPPAPEYDEAGVDLTQIREMLERSPVQRLRALRSAARGISWLQRATSQHEGPPSPRPAE